MVKTVYKIINTFNGKMYIGLTETRIEDRIAIHFSQLRRNKHYNTLLQQEFNFYGEKYFVWDIVESNETGVNHDREKYYMELYNTENPDKGYNCNFHKLRKEINAKWQKGIEPEILTEKGIIFTPEQEQRIIEIIKEVIGK